MWWILEKISHIISLGPLEPSLTIGQVLNIAVMWEQWKLSMQDKIFSYRYSYFWHR